MELLNPALAWCLAGVAAPVVIHLLNRFRFRTTDWAAMELLRRALVARSRRVRLEDLLLLLLRCAVVALVALAFARLTLAPQGGLAGGGDTGAVVAVDASFSMAHRPGVRSRFERAVERAQEVLGTLDPGRPVTLLLLGDRPRTLLRDVAYDPERVARALEDAGPFPERLDLERGLAEVESALAELRAPTLECHLVTDAQAASWKRLPDGARAALEGIAARGRVFLHPVGTGTSDNLSVDALELVSGSLRRGGTARWVARVRNHGSARQETVSVTLAANGVPVERRTADGPGPGGAVDVPLLSTLDRAGTVRFSARLEPDALPLDDTRRAVASVRERLRILCVDGDPAADPYASETGYLVLALESSGREGSVFVHVVSPAELAEQRLADHDLVVLANVPDLAEAQTASLAAWVRRGGALLTFLGDRVEPSIVNEALTADGEALLPATVLEARGATGADDAGRNVAPTGAAHPVSAALRRLDADFREGARVRRWFGLEPAEDARVLLEVSGPDDPLAVEGTLGAGRTLLVATSADRDWTDLVAHPLYPVLVQQFVTALVRPPRESGVEVGEPLVFRLPPGAEARRAVLRGPDGETRDVPVAWREGRAVVERERADRPGFWELRPEGDAPGVVAAVNLDARESAPAPLAGGALAEAIAPVEARIVAPGEDVNAAVTTGRTGRELSTELLIAALVVLALEGLLARRFSRGAGRTAA